MPKDMKKWMYLPAVKVDVNDVEAENEQSAFSVGYDTNVETRESVVLLSEFRLEEGGEQGKKFWRDMSEFRLEPAVALELGRRLIENAQEFLAWKLLGYDPMDRDEWEDTTEE